MIRTLVLALAITLTVPAVSYAAPGDEAAQAEYIRLSAEMKRLAERNAWEGVERTYERILATGVAPSYDDHFLAAQSSRSIGDVNGARSRLLAANDVREEREVMDWLWEIDSSYGKV